MKQYKLSGNEKKILLFDYIVKKRILSGTMPENPIVLRSILTSDMVDKIAHEYGIRLITITPNALHKLQKTYTDDKQRYIFSFSRGYPCLQEGQEATDKLYLEMKEAYGIKNIKPESILEEMYEKFGYYKEEFVRFEYSDESDIHSRMTMIKNYMPHTIGGYEILNIKDYSCVKSEAPEKADYIEYLLNNNVRMIISSKDHNKIEVYIFANGYSRDFVKYSVDNLEKYLRLELN